MRLFVGIDLPPLIHDHLALIRGGIPNARWLESDQLHVTLRFIGEVDGGTKQRIERTLEAVDQPVFPLSIAGVGYFPPSGKPRNLWAGLDDPTPLRALNGKLERALVSMGLPPERRNYSPHVTLARLRDSPTRKVIEFLQHHALLRTAEFSVDAFFLYSSVLSPRGTKYCVEQRYPLEP